MSRPISMSAPRLSNRLSIAIAIALWLPSIAGAELRVAESADDGDEPRLLAQLRVDPRGDGQWRVGVELVPDPGWHLYGRDPGEVGLPPRIEWQLPGARFGELAWPKPVAFVDPLTGIASSGYDAPVLLATTAEVPRGARSLAVHVEALVCAHMCLPALLDLTAALDASAPSPADRARFDAVERELASSDPARSQEPETSAVSWWTAVALGWLGGIVLNLMPCVLPVLAIKLAALAQLAERSRRDQVHHAVAYAAGIELSMLALAALVVGLRAAGTRVGWGFQLQEPMFLVAICALLVAFALNLFGAFEIHLDTSRLGDLGSRAPGPARSFFDGLLAVLLATPCSAPFLGTAIGFAFASPAPVIAAIFSAIGLGLATPFALAACSPAVARRMPRSGAWMGDLRAALGFGLLLTVVWLLWVLGRVRGPEAITPALLLLLAIAAASWALGLAQRRGHAVSGLAIAAVLGAVAAPGIVTFDLASSERAEPDAPVLERAQPWTPASLDESRAAQRPAFVYFTADWCMTCKVNELRVLSQPRVGAELERLGYDVYVADWTRRDEPVRVALAALGKAGVPVYAVYTPGAEEPALLPELLSVDGLLDALRDAAAEVVDPDR